MQTRIQTETVHKALNLVAKSALSIQRSAQHTKDGPEATLTFTATIVGGIDTKVFKANRKSIAATLKDIMQWLKKLAIEMRPEHVFRLFNLDAI